MKTFECNKPKHFIALYERELCEKPPKRVLEIGVQTGRSLRMWATAFPLAEIVGIDMSTPTEELPETNIRFIQGNQADASFLISLGEFDVIIDDGSHKTDDQIRSFTYLIHQLKSGGLYFIEDTETSYRFDYVHGQTAIEYAKGLVDFVNLDNWFSRVLFLKDIIMIEKI